jgi:hypothetical protein
MTVASSQSALTLPDHTQLPETNGTFVEKFPGASPKLAAH